MIKPTLKNQPNSYTYDKLFSDFSVGVPLAPDMVNFLYRHEKMLSSHGFDPILKYYLKPHYRKREEVHHSFLLPADKLTKDNTQQLKTRLEMFLRGNNTHAEFNLTPEEFTILQQAGYPELILYHGNHFLTGAPYYHGGIPHVIFFQWGNLFGVAKYVILPEERALKSNLLIYVEDMHDRYLNQCVNDYLRTHHYEYKPDQNALHQLQNTNHELKQVHSHSPYTIPKLTLAINSNKKEEE